MYLKLHKTQGQFQGQNKARVDLTTGLHGKFYVQSFMYKKLTSTN